MWQTQPPSDPSVGEEFSPLLTYTPAYPVSPRTGIAMAIAIATAVQPDGMRGRSGNRFCLRESGGGVTPKSLGCLLTPDL